VVDAKRAEDLAVRVTAAIGVGFYPRQAGHGAAPKPTPQARRRKR
jgi:hypothetical protein